MLHGTGVKEKKGEKEQRYPDSYIRTYTESRERAIKDIF